MRRTFAHYYSYNIPFIGLKLIPLYLHLTEKENPQGYIQLSIANILICILFKL